MLEGEENNEERSFTPPRVGGRGVEDMARGSWRMGRRMTSRRRRRARKRARRTTRRRSSRSSRSSRRRTERRRRRRTTTRRTRTRSRRNPSAARGKGQGGRRRPTHQSLQGVDKAGTAIFYFTTLTNIKQLPPAVKQTNLSAAAVAPFPPLVHRPRVDVRVAVRRLFVRRRAIRRARGGTRRTPPS